MKIASSTPVPVVTSSAEQPRTAAAQPDPPAGVSADDVGRKHQLDRAILETSLNTTLKAGNQPLALLYASAIEHLNEILAPEFGDNAIQRAVDAGIDVSPEATAGRIVSMSTAFFGAYREAHPELDLDSALESFANVIGGGIDRGFAEARDVLDGLGVLGGDIAANIDKTYALVQQGLKDFAATISRPQEPG